jgi:hypothetical protein
LQNLLKHSQSRSGRAFTCKGLQPVLGPGKLDQKAAKSREIRMIDFWFAMKYDFRHSSPVSDFNKEGA